MSSHGLKTTFGDGTWFVGKDIAPGTYSTQDAGICTYDTTSPGGGGQHGQQSNASTPGQVTVSIDSNVTTFTTHGCGTWIKQ